MLMRNVRKQAEELGILMVFCRHSATEVRERLDELGCGRCVSKGKAEVMCAKGLIHSIFPLRQVKSTAGRGA